MATRNYIRKRNNYIRPPTQADMHDLIGLGRAFHEESWYRDMDLSIAKLVQLIEGAIAGDPYFGYVAIDKSNRPIGYAMALCHEHYFGTDLTVTDLGIYLLPEYRSPLVAATLVRELEEWAFEHMGAKDINLGVSSGIADERIVRFYERLGFGKNWFGVSKKSPLTKSAA